MAGTKAIVLAAGEGSRLGSLTSDRPKCMVNYRGRAIFSYIEEALSRAGISDLTVVTGHRAHWFDNLGIRTIHNPDYKNSNMVYSLFLASQELLGNEVVVSYGDIVYHPDLVLKLLSCPDDLAILIDLDWLQLWQQRMADPLSDAETLVVDADGFIQELGKRPSSYREIAGQYIGLFKIGARILPDIISHYEQLFKQPELNARRMCMTDFIQTLINKGYKAKAVFFRGGWVEIDSPSDLMCEQRPFSLC